MRYFILMAKTITIATLTLLLGAATAGAQSSSEKVRDNPAAQYVLVKTVVGKTNNFTPKNVRVPVVLKVSQTSAEMLINGVSAVKATGFTLPFTQGEWTITHRAFYAPRSPSFPAYLQLIHWQTVQFDGPGGSFSPVGTTVNFLPAFGPADGVV